VNERGGTGRRMSGAVSKSYGGRVAEVALCYTRDHVGVSHALHAHTRTRAHVNAHAQSYRGEPPACARLPFRAGARVFTVVEIDNTSDRCRRRRRRRRVDGFFFPRLKLRRTLRRRHDRFHVTSSIQF